MDAFPLPGLTILASWFPSARLVYLTAYDLAFVMASSPPVSATSIISSRASDALCSSSESPRVKALLVGAADASKLDLDRYFLTLSSEVYYFKRLSGLLEEF